MNGAYRSFVIPKVPKGNMDGYLDQAEPHTKALIEDQLKEMQSRNVIKTLSVRLKEPVQLAITINPDDVAGAQDIGDKTGDNYDRVDMSFKSFTAEFLKMH